jgi:urea transport system ATP-binding protein
MLEVHRLNQSYGESRTLWDMELTVEQGSFTCLMGRNGVGKTTLLKTIMGLLPVKSGEIRFGDIELAREASERRAEHGIGYVPQGREIFGQLTVAENLRIGLTARGRRAAGIPNRIFEFFPVLRNMLNRRGGDLSGGQQQQLAIGRALALDPQMLILDEPTEGIQPNIVSHIAEILTELNRNQGLTVLLVEQKLPFARKLADRFVVMDRGRAVASGAIAGLSSEVVSKYLTV